jgi:hypothetical protein
MEISSRPVRKIVVRGATRVTGYFASHKMGHLVPWERHLERDFIILAEIDPAVSAFYAQPLETQYWAEAKLYHYTPPFAVDVGSRTEIHDVKPDHLAAEPVHRSHLLAAARVIEHEGYSFHLTTAARIYREPYFSTAKALARCLHHPVDADDELFLIDLLDTMPGLPLVALLDGRYGREIPPTSLYAMLARGTITTDFGSPLSLSSPLTRTSNPTRFLPMGVAPS